MGSKVGNAKLKRPAGSWRSSALSALLWLGGLPPLVSGLVAVLAPGIYLRLTLDVGRFDSTAYSLLLFLLRLQGGDAFVAGAARIAVAACGDLRLKKLLAVPAIAHSAFELWLLPSRLLAWCNSHPEAGCSEMLVAEVWLFMALHAVLVCGFTVVLLADWAQRGKAA